MCGPASQLAVSTALEWKDFRRACLSQTARLAAAEPSAGPRTQGDPVGTPALSETPDSKPEHIVERKSHFQVPGSSFPQKVKS